MPNSQYVDLQKFPLCGAGLDNSVEHNNRLIRRETYLASHPSPAYPAWDAVTPPSPTKSSPSRLHPQGYQLLLRSLRAFRRWLAARLHTAFASFLDEVYDRGDVCGTLRSGCGDCGKDPPFSTLYERSACESFASSFVFPSANATFSDDDFFVFDSTLERKDLVFFFNALRSRKSRSARSRSSMSEICSGGTETSKNCIWHGSGRKTGLKLGPP
jgi:hypothetical protein